MSTPKRRKLREPATNTTYLLSHATEILNRRILEGVVAAGHEIRAAHAAVFINIDREGSRLTTIAERAAMTPQAMGELVDDLCRRGYLERVPDPDDRRAKLILLTDRGWDALQAAYDTIIDIEADLEAQLGRAGLARVQRTLRGIAGDS